MENGETCQDVQQQKNIEVKIEKALEERKPLKLHSPGGGDSFIYSFNQPEVNHFNALDILDLIRSVLPDYPEIEAVISKFCKLEDVDVHSYSTIRSLCKRFNKAVHQMLKNETPPRSVRSAMNKDLLRQVVTRCYNRAVDNEKALNKHYEAFSSQTYGETSYDRMQMILDEINPGSEDVFVDLGSGVGQLVVHVSGAVNLKRAVGIEIAQLPSRFANVLESEFKRHMNWYGSIYSPFQLEQGDFLDVKYRDLITQEATIIFINNYAFQSDLETRIKMELLRELKDGTRIITTKPYVPLNKNGVITDRQMNDISVIIDITELKQCPNPCSWTSAYVPYYMHVINRAKLERYFLNRNPALRDGARRSSTPSSKNSNSRESSVGLRESKNGYKLNGTHTNDDVGYGPTTRRKWQEYVCELDQQKRKKFTEKSEDVTAMFPKPVSHSPIFPSYVFSDGRDDEDSEDSIPIKKQRRSIEKKKDKSFRGRPRKSDGGHKNASICMSIEAREGIELMHQMTKAISCGEKVDPAALLAGLSNHNTSTRDNVPDLENSKANFVHDDQQASGSSTGLVHLPFPNLAQAVARSESASNLLEQSTTNLQLNSESSHDLIQNWRTDLRKAGQAGEFSSTKYPSLNKFLTELRFLYENFLDNMQTPEFVRTLSDKINSEKAKKEQDAEANSTCASDGTPIKQEIMELNKMHTPVDVNVSCGARSLSFAARHNFAERAEKLVALHKEIAKKSKELDECTTKYHVELEKFSSEIRDAELEYHEEQLRQLSRGDCEQNILQKNNEESNMQQRNDFMLAIARQQMLHQQQNVQQTQSQISLQTQSASDSLFPSTNGIEQLVVSDLVHQYSQQKQQQLSNNSLLFSQLGQLLAPRLHTASQASSTNSLITPSVRTEPSSALQPAIFNNGCVLPVNGPEANTILRASSNMPQNFSLNNRAELAAAIATLSASQLHQNQQNLLNPSSLQTSTTQQQLIQSILNSIAGKTTNKSNAFELSSNEANCRDMASAESALSNENCPKERPNYNNKLNELIAAAANLSPNFSHNAAQQSQQFQQQVSTISMDSDMMIPSTSSSNTTISSTAVTLDEHSTVAAVVAAVAAGATKKPRSKSSRSSTSSKRNSYTSKQTPEDPEKQEEIERQIQVIVAKALEVDSVAKQSEKERKARSFEKRRDKCSATLSIATPNFAGTSANVSANFSASSNTSVSGKKRNCNDTISSGGNNSELLSPISTNAANSSFGGSASNSAIASPVALISNQNFSSSAASACAQLLSTANTLSSAMISSKQPISIVSVAPPPHSPPMNMTNTSSIMSLPLNAFSRDFSFKNNSASICEFTQSSHVNTAITDSSASIDKSNPKTSSQLDLSVGINAFSKFDSTLTIDTSNCHKATYNSELLNAQKTLKIDEDENRNTNISQGQGAIASTSITISTDDGKQKLSQITATTSAFTKVSPHTTQYVPLSKRTLMEDFKFTLPPLSLAAEGFNSTISPSPMAKSSSKHSSHRHSSSSIKTEKQDF